MARLADLPGLAGAEFELLSLAILPTLLLMLLCFLVVLALFVPGPLSMRHHLLRPILLIKEVPGELILKGAVVRGEGTLPLENGGLQDDLVLLEEGLALGGPTSCPFSALLFESVTTFKLPRLAPSTAHPRRRIPTALSR